MFRYKLYSDLDGLQTDLGNWLRYYNNGLTHLDEMCCGRTEGQYE